MQFFRIKKIKIMERFSVTATHIYFIIAILLMIDSYNWRYCNSWQYINEKVNSNEVYVIYLIICATVTLKLITVKDF